MHLYVICGHGAGDPGACGNGYSEAERVRALGARIAALGGSSVTLLDTSRNWYADRGINSLSIPSGDALVELHMDSANASARGGHVIIASGLGGPDAYDRALAASISAIFPGRSQTIVERSNLANPNRAKRRGINYRLVENGFITNAGDVETFNSRLDDIARAYLAAFGISGGGEPQAVEDGTKDAITQEEVEEMAATGMGVIVNPQGAKYEEHPGGLYRITADHVYHYTNADQPRADDILSRAMCGEDVPRIDMASYGTDPWFERMVQARGGWDAVIHCPSE